MQYSLQKCREVYGLCKLSFGDAPAQNMRPKVTCRYIPLPICSLLLRNPLNVIKIQHIKWFSPFHSKTKTVLIDTNDRKAVKLHLSPENTEKLLCTTFNSELLPVHEATQKYYAIITKLWLSNNIFGS